MSSTNKTTNYELSQFIETDRPAWLTDYNSDMRKLDTAIKGVSDVASGASGSISSLTDRMTAAEGAISTNANDIDALEARADALEAQAQSTAGTIANIQTEQTAQNLGIEAATELGYNLARPYDSASTYAVGDYVLFQNTLYKCVTAIATGEAFDPTKWIAIKAMDEVGGGEETTLEQHLLSDFFFVDTGDITTSNLSNYTCYRLGNLLFVGYSSLIVPSISHGSSYQVALNSILSVRPEYTIKQFIQKNNLPHRLLSGGTHDSIIATYSMHINNNNKLATTVYFIEDSAPSITELSMSGIYTITNNS